MVHLSLEPPGTHLAPHQEEVFFLDQKDLVRMMILMTMRRNDSMMMSMPPILCFKDYPKTSTSSSITTLKQKRFGTTSKCFLLDLSSPKKTENLSCVQPYTQSSPFQSHQYPPSSAPLLSPHVQSLLYPQFAESSQLDSGYTQADEILGTLTKQVALLA
nr:hypothetical protein [Tanacetum cinerariifolium]